MAAVGEDNKMKLFDYKSLLTQQATKFKMEVCAMLERAGGSSSPINFAQPRENIMKTCRTSIHFRTLTTALFIAIGGACTRKPPTHRCSFCRVST